MPQITKLVSNNVIIKATLSLDDRNTLIQLVLKIIILNSKSEKFEKIIDLSMYEVLLFLQNRPSI